MTTRLEWAVLSVSLVLVVAVATAGLAAPDEPVAYDRFLEDSAPTGGQVTTSRDPTWTVEPGPEGTIKPAEQVRPSRQAPLDPELDGILSEQQARSVAADTDEVNTDIASFLRPAQTGPHPAGAAGAKRMVTILSAALVAVLGALAGIAVTLWRARRGKLPDPARRIRLIK